MIAADVEGQVTPNQWLKRPLLNDRYIERSWFWRQIREEIMYIVYILYIVYIPYARNMHGKEVFFVGFEPVTWRITE
jgi:hypothetical protein